MRTYAPYTRGEPIFNWNRLRKLTRIGLVASGLAFVTIAAPFLSVVFALGGAGSSGVAWRRAHKRSEVDKVAKYCFIGCISLITVVVVGSALYGAAA